MEKQKHIWIVNYYTAPPEYVGNPRHLQFAHYLQEVGYKVTIFSTGYLHGKDIDLVDNGEPYKIAQYGELHYVHIKVPHYKGNGLNRMRSIWVFARRIFKYRKKFERPDIIYQNMHAPFDTAISLCAKKMNVRYIAEQWDLWPDDFVKDGLISKKNPLMIWAYWQERKMYYRASDIIFSFAGGLDYLKRKKLTVSTGGKILEDRVHYINNGINILKFEQDKKQFILRDTDLENDEIFKIVYIGSIKLANNIKFLIDAVNLLKEYTNIKLFIYGDGYQREELISYCKYNNIINVVFKNNWIPLEYVPYVVSRSNLNIMNYHKTFGLYGVSSGKLFQYLAAGKPIICNVDISYDDIISDNNLGFSGWVDSPNEYAKRILEIYQLSNYDYTNICNRVKEVACKFDYKVLSKKLINVLDNVKSRTL